MVFPSIRSVEEIDCLTLLGKNTQELLLSYKPISVHQNNRKTKKIINPRTINKSLRVGIKKVNYPIAS